MCRGVRTNQQCTNLHSDTTLLQPNHTNTPVHTETEQYTYRQSPAPDDECNSIRNMLSNKKLSLKWHQVGSIYSTNIIHMSNNHKWKISVRK